MTKKHFLKLPASFGQCPKEKVFFSLDVSPDLVSVEKRLSQDLQVKGTQRVSVQQRARARQVLLGGHLRYRGGKQVGPASSLPIYGAPYIRYVYASDDQELSYTNFRPGYPIRWTWSQQRAPEKFGKSCSHQIEYFSRKWSKWNDLYETFRIDWGHCSW